ncbi:hypothetical protein AKJ09_05735 [Labilithrix luteola]|uniref:Tryptophan synthase alpha chain n=1 Tax=Labilithrix luteola TaxID=1391654 RepID=A0A0K1Q0A0_9BACT|nr:hypothetical protein [Labilithrix luteola]AKU99071.1 hypothetical protein AKJ09_05735 [Labilithrix luteola]
MLSRLLVCFAGISLLLAVACGSEPAGDPSSSSSPNSANARGGADDGSDAAPNDPSNDPSTDPKTSCADACTEGARSCEGAGFASCERGPSGCTGWSAIEKCASGEFCSAGRCTKSCTNQCTEGSVQCSATSNGISTCAKQPSGCTDWSAPVACSSPKVCSGGQCVSQCTNQCTVGAKQCSGIGNGVATCVLKPSGCTDWDAPVACDGNTACSGGQCVSQCTNQCTVGAKQCAGVGNGVATCVVKASGCTDWDTPAPCDANKTCSGGQCLTQCTNQCTAGAKQCSGQGVATCVVKPSGCTDWDTAVACTGGQTCAGGVCQGGGPVTWRVAASPTTQMLRDVWGANASDVWAVGDAGSLLHYDGAAWSAANSGTTADLVSIWGSSASNVWAVSTTNAEILHYDGTKWTKSTPLATAAFFSTIWGTGANDVWAAGAIKNGGGTYSQFLGHFDGTTWSAVTGTAAPSMGGWLGSVWSNVPNDVWVFDGLGNASHLRGGTWTAISQVGFKAMGTSPNDVWFPYGSYIKHYDGTTVSSVTSPFANGQWYDVFTRTSTDAWMVGTSGRVIHFNGAAWSVDSNGTGLTTSALWGVWANSSSDVWAVGDKGVILHLGS